MKLKKPKRDEDGNLVYESDGVTVEYEDESPVRVDTIVISTQHEENVDLDVLKRDIKEEVINKYNYERNHDPLS